MFFPVSETVVSASSSPSESNVVPGPLRTLSRCMTRPVGPVGVGVASSGISAPAATWTYCAVTQAYPCGAEG